MAEITVTPLSTSNTTPTIIGTVSLDRDQGETILVRVDYKSYELFDGNLGLDEDQIPNVWKLHFDEPLTTGVYDVDAFVLDKNKNIIASEITAGELRISVDDTIAAQNQTLQKKIQRMQNLQLGMTLLNAAMGAFGGGGSSGPHPATNDDSSTHLHARGKEEFAKSSEQKDLKKKKYGSGGKGAPVPKKAENKATKGSSGGGDVPEGPDSNELEALRNSGEEMPSGLNANDVKNLINDAADVKKAAPISIPAGTGVNASGGIIV